MLQGRWGVCRAVVDGDLRPDVLLQPTAFFRAARHRNDPAASDAGHLARHRADRSGRAGYEHGHAGLWLPHREEAEIGGQAVGRIKRNRVDRNHPSIYWREDRKSVVEGKSVSGRVYLGGRRIIKKKMKCTKTK